MPGKRDASMDLPVPGGPIINKVGHNTPMTKFAYSYLRFSTPEQAKGDSERRQRMKFDAYCKAQGMTPAADSFADRGRSGYKAEHLDDTGELRRFLDLVQRGEIPEGSTLVVENLDRLGRQDVETAFGVFTSILAAGIRIVTLPDNQPPQEFVKGKLDLVRLVMVLMDMSRAHEESRRKSELVGAAFANKLALAREACKPMGAACPLWLRQKMEWRSYAEDGSAYEEIPERAEVVRLIFRLTIEGYGRGVIAQKLNADGIPSFKADLEKLKAKGFTGLWGTSSVDKVLKNRAVFGEYQPKTSRGAAKGKTVKAGDPIPEYYPAVVSVETFYEAQAAIDGRRTTKATKQSKKFNVWQGVAKCERCGGAMHMVHKGQPPKGGSYLRCANIGKGGCKAKHYRLDETEAVFLGMLVRLDALSLVQDSSATIEKHLQAVRGQLVEARRKLSALQKTLDEDWESPTFLAAVKRVEGEVKTLEKQNRSLEADLAAEQGIGWDEFLKRLDLVSYEGRAKANNVVKRQGVIVQIGPSGYLVTQDGEARFQMDFRDGHAGYLRRSGFKGQFLTFVSVAEVPRMSAAEDAYYDQQDAMEGEGQPAEEGWSHVRA